MDTQVTTDSLARIAERSSFVGILPAMMTKEILKDGSERCSTAIPESIWPSLNTVRNGHVDSSPNGENCPPCFGGAASGTAASRTLTHDR